MGKNEDEESNDSSANTKKDSGTDIFKLRDMYMETVKTFLELLEAVDPEFSMKQKNLSSKDQSTEKLSADDQSDAESNAILSDKSDAKLIPLRSVKSDHESIISRSDRAQLEKSLKSASSERKVERTDTEVRRYRRAPRSTTVSPLIPVLVDLATNTLLPVAISAAKSYIKRKQMESPNFIGSPSLYFPNDPSHNSQTSSRQRVNDENPNYAYQQQTMQGQPNIRLPQYPRQPYQPQYQIGYEANPSVYFLPLTPLTQQHGTLPSMQQGPYQHSGQEFSGSYSQTTITPQHPTGFQLGYYPAQADAVQEQQIYPHQWPSGPVYHQGYPQLPPQQPSATTPENITPDQWPSRPPPESSSQFPSQQIAVQDQPPPGYSQYQNYPKQFENSGQIPPETYNPLHPGTQNPPQGRIGNQNPSQGYPRPQNPTRGPTGYSGTQNHPQGLPGTQNPPQGRKTPPQGYPGAQVPLQGYLTNQNPPQGYPGTQVPPQGYITNQNPPQGYPGTQYPVQGRLENPNPPQGYPSNPQDSSKSPIHHKVVQGQPPPGHSQYTPQQFAKLGQTPPGTQNIPQEYPYGPQKSPQDPSKQQLGQEPFRTKKSGRGPSQFAPHQKKAVKEQSAYTRPQQGPNQPQNAPKFPQPTRSANKIPSTPPPLILPTPTEIRPIPTQTRSAPPVVYQPSGQLPEYTRPGSQNHKNGSYQLQGVPLESYTLQTPPGENFSTPAGPYQVQTVTFEEINQTYPQSHYLPQPLCLTPGNQRQSDYPGSERPSPRIARESPLLNNRNKLSGSGNAVKEIWTPRDGKVKRTKSLRKKLEGEVIHALENVENQIYTILKKLRLKRYVSLQ